jgi:GT2 family glycosyltransferase
MFFDFLRAGKLATTPLAGVESEGDGRYRVADADAGGTFELAGELPEGWVELSLELAGEGRARVLADVGAGFEKALRIPLPALDGAVRAIARVPRGTRGLRLEITGASEIRLTGVSIRKLPRAEAMARLVAPMLKRSFIQPRDVPQAVAKLFGALRAGGVRGVFDQLARRQTRRDVPVVWYPEWYRLHVALSPDDHDAIRKLVAHMTRRPSFDVVLVARRPEDPNLGRAIASVRAQLYPDWRLFVAGEGQAPPELQRLAAEDQRVQLVFEDGGRSASAALDRGRGEWIVTLDPEDELAEHALFEFAREAAAVPEPDVIYGDEDALDPAGSPRDPKFKPDWNPDLFSSQNYIGRACALRRERVREVGGLRAGDDANGGYGLLLRASSSGRVRHVPLVLLHERGGPTPFDAEAGVRTLQTFLGSSARAEPGPVERTFRVRWPLPPDPPLVSVIVPTRDHGAILKTMVESFFATTSYRPYELIIVDNQSSEPAALDYLASLSGRARVLRYDKPFNFSAINNFAVEQARGSVLCLLNNDVEIIEEEWLAEMVSQALRPEIGAVGARLLYPDRTLQHGGVVVGLGGVASHAHKHLAETAPGYCGRARIVQDMTAVTAACLCIRKETWQRVSGFEERLAVAFNDVDFCLRVRATGLRNLWTPYATLLHHESKSRGEDDVPEKRARFLAEGKFIQQRWGEVLKRDPAYNPNLTVEAEDFSLAWSPRITPTWREETRGAGWFRGTVRARR